MNIYVYMDLLQLKMIAYSLFPVLMEQMQALICVETNTPNEILHNRYSAQLSVFSFTDHFKNLKIRHTAHSYTHCGKTLHVCIL